MAMRRWIAAHVLIGLGLVWLIIDRVLLIVAYASWGGPNIGGGFFLMVAVAAVVSGITMLRRRAPTDRRPSPWVRRAALALEGALVVAVVVSNQLSHEPQGPAGNGWVGITVTSTGSPVAVLEICSGSVRRVDFYGPNRGGAPNEQLGSLTPRVPVARTTTLDLRHRKARGRARRCRRRLLGSRTQ